MRFGLLIAAMILNGAGAALAADAKAPPDAAEAPRLIAELGGPSFRGREEAMRELVDIGIAAKPFLLEATKHRDPEIRKRAQAALVPILERDFQARLNAFILDVEGKVEHDLPCWDRYKSQVGDDFRSRELFVELIRAEGTLLEAVEADPRSAGSVLDARCKRLMQTSFRVRRDDNLLRMVTAYCFVAGQPDVPLSSFSAEYISKLGNGLPSVVTSTASEASFSQYSESLRRILANWIGRELDEAAFQASLQNLSTGYSNEFAECVVPAVAVLRRVQTPANSRQTALLAIARYGKQKHAELVEGLIADTTNFGNNVQLGDIALAAAIKLYGKNPHDFGFRNVTSGKDIFKTSSLGFATQADREASREKWREFKATLALKAPQSSTSDEGGDSPQP